MSKLRTKHWIAIGFVVLAVLTTSVFLYTQASPSVSFSKPVFTAHHLADSHWGPGESWLIVKTTAKNDSVLPLWYKVAPPETWAVGASENTAAAIAKTPGFKESKWRRLSSGQSVELREYHLDADEFVGFDVKDILGRSHTIIAESINVTVAWETRHSLPQETSD